MSQGKNNRVGLAFCLIVATVALVGCNKSNGATAEIKPASGPAEAAKRTISSGAATQQLAAQNAQGAEADAKRRAEAMAKATKP